MMKNIKRILIIIILIISFSSCKKEENIDENKPSSSNYVCAGVKDLTIGEIYEDELEPYTYIDYNFTIEESGYYNVSTIVNGYDDTYSNLWEVKLDYYFYNEHQMTYLLWDNTINQMANILWLDKLKMHYFVKSHSYTLTMRFIADYVLQLPKVNNPIKTYKIQVQKADYGLDRLWDYERQYFIYEPEESGIYSLGSYGDETTLYYSDITNDEIFKYNDTNYKDIDLNDLLVHNVYDEILYFKKGNKYLLRISISSSNEEEYIFNPKLSLITEETDNLKKITIDKTGIYQFKYPESRFMRYKFYDEETTLSIFTQYSFVQLYEGMTLWYLEDDKYGFESLEYTGYDFRCYVDGEEIINGHSYKYKLGLSHVELSLTYNGEYVQATSNHSIFKTGSNINYSDQYFDDSDEGDFSLGFADATYKEPLDTNFIYYRYGDVKINYLGVMTNINFEIFTYDIRG